MPARQRTLSLSARYGSPETNGLTKRRVAAGATDLRYGRSGSERVGQLPSLAMTGDRWTFRAPYRIRRLPR